MQWVLPRMYANYFSQCSEWAPCFYGYRPDESTAGRLRVSPGTAISRESVVGATDKHNETETALVSQYIHFV